MKRTNAIGHGPLPGYGRSSAWTSCGFLFLVANCESWVWAWTSKAHRRSEAEAFAWPVGREDYGRYRGFANHGRKREQSFPKLFAAADGVHNPAVRPNSPSIASTAASVTKSLVGAGMLSLSAGVAAFTRAPEGLLLAIVMVIGMTAVSAYTFDLVAQASVWSDSRDFGDTWAATVGKRYTWVSRIAACAGSGLACLIYAIVLGDSLTSIFRGVLTAPTGFGLLDAWRDSLLPWCSRGPLLVALTFVVLFPLCLAEGYSNLAASSAVGVAASCFVAAFAVCRSLDGSYLPGGRFFSHAPAMPAALVRAKDLTDVLNLRSLVLLAMVGTTTMGHAMAPGTVSELGSGMTDATDTAAAQTETLRRHRLVTALAFAVAGALGISVMAAGFCTFGASSGGLLLANYADTDTTANVARACLMISLLFGFPLNFVVLRTEIFFAFVQCPKARLANRGRKRLTIALLSMITGISAVVQDLGKLQAIVGATVGGFIIYVAPALMARGMRRKRGEGGVRHSIEEFSLIMLGIVVGSMGVALTCARQS